MKILLALLISTSVFANQRYIQILDEDGSILVTEDSVDGSLDFKKDPKYVAKLFLKSSRSIQQNYEAQIKELKKTTSKGDSE